MVKPSDILLGETKYYTAKPDPDQYSNLIITESSSPDLGDGDERVIFEDPKIADDAINNDSVGVYWDYMKPDTTGLDNGVIRLIGKRWKPDTTYKVKLHAVLKELGREGAVEIEVKEPPGCILVKNASCSESDTISLCFYYEETGAPVPASRLIDVYIPSEDNGNLLVKGKTDINFNGATQPIKYISPKDITGDSLVVPIIASKSESTGGISSSANIHLKDSLKLPLNKNSTMSSHILKVLQTSGGCESGNMTTEDPKFPPCNDQTSLAGIIETKEPQRDGK